MKLKALFYLLLIVLIACKENQNKTIEIKKPDTVDTLVFALDWSPNILHAGFFMALKRGDFEKENLHIEWFSPEIDDYKKSPINKVVFGGADIGISNTEQMLVFGADCEGRVNAQAIATFLHGASRVFVSKKENLKIFCPKCFDGKKYFYYFSPMEKEVIENMNINHGGEGHLEMKRSNRLQAWEYFVNDSVDIAWVNDYWETVLAEVNNIPLNTYAPEDFGVPYGYAALLVISTDLEEQKKQAIKRFLKVLQKNYLEIYTGNAVEIAKELHNTIDHPNFQDLRVLEKAVEKIQPLLFKNPQKPWGYMEAEVWENYYLWMKDVFGDKSEIVHAVKVEELYSNQMLQ